MGRAQGYPDLSALVAAFETPDQGRNRGAEQDDLSARLLSALQALIEMPDDTPGRAAFEQLLNAILARWQESRIDLHAQLQKAQFEARHFQLAASPSEDQDAPRLDGDAHALGRLFAQALAQLDQPAQKHLFGTGFYLRQNPDVAATGLDPLTHYLSTGAEEGRWPCDLRVRTGGNGRPGAPADLTALAASDRPGFVSEFPPALRQAALALVGRTRPRISVVIPSWNRAHILPRAVASALLQSLTPFEVIVVDDGSTDDTEAVLRAQFSEPLDAGHLVLISQSRRGVSAARNAGLARATGEIIAYLDSDNIWETDHLLFAAAGLLHGPVRHSAYTALCRHNLGDGWSDVLFSHFDRAALETTNYIDLNSFVHHRALFDKLGGFDEGLTRLVDWDLILRYTARSPAAALPVITGHYFTHGSVLRNITTTEEAEPNIARIRAKLAAEQNRT